MFLIFTGSGQLSVADGDAIDSALMPDVSYPDFPSDYFADSSQPVDRLSRSLENKEDLDSVGHIKQFAKSDDMNGIGRQKRRIKSKKSKKKRKGKGRGRRRHPHKAITTKDGGAGSEDVPDDASKKKDRHSDTPPQARSRGRGKKRRKKGRRPKPSPKDESEVVTVTEDDQQEHKSIKGRGHQHKQPGPSSLSEKNKESKLEEDSDGAHKNKPEVMYEPTPSESHPEERKRGYSTPKSTSSPPEETVGDDLEESLEEVPSGKTSSDESAPYMIPSRDRGRGHHPNEVSLYDGSEDTLLNKDEWNQEDGEKEEDEADAEWEEEQNENMGVDEEEEEEVEYGMELEEKEGDDITRCKSCEPLVGEEVCGRNGRTYNSFCHAINCARLLEDDISPGPCTEKASSVAVYILYMC